MMRSIASPIRSSSISATARTVGDESHTEDAKSVESMTSRASSAFPTVISVAASDKAVITCSVDVPGRVLMSRCAVLNESTASR